VKVENGEDKERCKREGRGYREKKKKKRKSPPTFTASDFYVEVRTYVVVLFTHYK